VRLLQIKNDDPEFEHGAVNHPEHDHRVRDVDRFMHDRRVEANAAIALWSRSRKPGAAEDIAHWTGVLRDIDRKAAKMMQQEAHRLNQRTPDD